MSPAPARPAPRPTRRERLVDLSYAAGWRVVRALPGPVAAGAFDVGARVAARRGGRGPDQLRRNLARVLGCPPAEVPDALVAAGLRSYARYWREAFRLPRTHAEVTTAVRDRVADDHLLLDVLAQGRGAVLALPHAGNWDAAGLWLVDRLGTFTTIVERLQPESLYERFVAYREGLGFEIVPLTGGAENPLRACIRRLQSGGVVALLADRDLGSTGVAATLFGEEVRLPPGPARLAQHTGAALLPATCFFDGDGWGFRVYPEVPVGRGPAGVAAACQGLADAFAEALTAHPEDWHALQPVFTADRAGAR